MLITTSTFTSEAQEFAKDNNLILVNGASLIESIRELGEEKSKALLELATAGDYTTPTCPRCDVKMKWREGGSFKPFWGCVNYPRCSHKFFASQQI
jgi:restriction system protein